MYFGTHVSIAGGIDNAPDRAFKLGCECFQIFTRSPRGGKPPPLDDKVVSKFLSDCKKHGLGNYYVHTPYFLNLASMNEEVRDNSINIIREDLERSSLLEVKYVMTHLGSSKGMERKAAISRVSGAVAEILEGYEGKTKLLLENSAGQGDTIGNEFEELAMILSTVDNDDLGICLDTAHMFGAGYDVRNSGALDFSLKHAETTFGMDRLKLIHGNDTKVGLGERKDRHELIGKGNIGVEGFKAIISDQRLSSVDIIVENPPDKVAADIGLLKQIRSEVL